MYYKEGQHLTQDLYVAYFFYPRLTAAAAFTFTLDFVWSSEFKL